MKRLAIIGSGELGQQIAWHAKTDQAFEVAGFFDDYKQQGMRIHQYPVLGRINSIEAVFEKGGFDELLIGIGYKHMAAREELFERFHRQIPFARFIHSSCIVDPSSEIRAGAVLYPGCIIDQHVQIRENVLLNLGCCIAHDSVVGAHSFLSPHVAVAGFVEIGNLCNIGINATVIDNIKIVKETRLGAGAVVITNILRSGLYVGNPIRFIRS